MDNVITVKSALCTAIGCFGSIVASAFGGFNMGLKILIVLMVADYITGLMVAGVFHTSTKTDSGGLESGAGWKGLCRKGVTLLVVLVAQCVDTAAGTSIIRDAVVLGYTANEAISITENAGLMGVPIPARLAKAIDVLQGKAEDK